MAAALCHRLGIPTIAEKVETDQQFQSCREIGYDFFQGYFFCRPQIVGRRSVPANKTVYLQLLQAANEQALGPFFTALAVMAVEMVNWREAHSRQASER